ncbi:MAG: hypothetical protein U0625_13725, partial [Phycisphaerales bacterium]
MTALRHSILPAACVLAVLLLGWEAVVLLWTPPEYLLPAPLTVARTLWEERGTLLPGAGLTGLAAVGGFAIAAALGVLAGSLLAASRFLMRGLYPLATLLQMVP